MNERLHELLADEATVGLDASEQAELEALLARHPDADRDALARVAAEVALSGLPDVPTQLPPALRGRLEADAASFFAAASPESTSARPSARGAAPPPRRRWLAGAGWLAAAAGWLLVVFLAWPQAEGPTLAQQARRLAEAPGSVRVAWTAGGDATGSAVRGDVVWSDARQEGYMRFEGLVANDPTREQYQLWIFDASREAAHPVDGGVFDVAEGGEVIVPIRAHLPVDRATLFAVTVERPGGVVVSSRERIAVLASVEEAEG